MLFWLATAAAIGLAMLIAVFGPVLVRQRVALERLVVNNEVAGFSYATIAVIFAVLAAFMVIALWEEFREAEVEVRLEAGAVVSLGHLAIGLDDRARESVRDGLDRYLETVLREEWPAMAGGAASPAAGEALTQVYRLYAAIEPGSAHDRLILNRSLELLSEVSEHRRERIAGSASAVAAPLWMALMIGAFVTIGFQLLFGSPNLAAHSAMSGLVAVVVLTVILVIVLLDRPFAGVVRVSPEPLAGARGELRSAVLFD